MNSKKVEIEITLNTGFNMFLNPSKIVLKFDKEVIKKSKQTKKK